MAVKTRSTAPGALPAGARETPDLAKGFAGRLAIIVPYRDRRDHLAKFVPHISAYLARDKRAAGVKHSISIIEQSNGAPFNAGKLKNVGFHLTEASHDSFCFHDVDYLPIAAEYSNAKSPARLIWHGLRLEENYIDFFGAVVLFNRDDFRRVNGYSNRYVGWGFEDIDLHLRCIAAGLTIERRDGRFQSLPHKHRGASSDGRLAPETLRNRDLFNTSMAELKRTRTIPDDGLSDLVFAVEAQTPIAPGATLYRVRI